MAADAASQFLLPKRPALSWCHCFEFCDPGVPFVGHRWGRGKFTDEHIDKLGLAGLASVASVCDGLGGQRCVGIDVGNTKDTTTSNTDEEHIAALDLRFTKKAYHGACITTLDHHGELALGQHASATRVEIDSEVVNAPWVEHETISSVWSGHEHGTNTTRPLFVPNDYLYGFVLKELASSLS